MAADANRTLWCVILGLALCLPMLPSAVGASLDGTFDENGTSRLTKYVLNRNILFNGKRGSPIQLTVNPVEIPAAAPCADRRFGRRSKSGYGRIHASQFSRSDHHELAAFV